MVISQLVVSSAAKASWVVIYVRMYTMNNHTYNGMESHQTILNRSVPCRTVLPQIASLQRSRTVPSANINKTAQV